MNYRRLGRTGLMVSEVGFGGEWLERHDEAHSVNLIRHAHEKGVNIICLAVDAPSDTINAMTGKIDRLSGVSAKAVCSRSIERD